MASATTSFPLTESPISEAGAWTSGPGPAGDFLTNAGFARVSVIDVDSIARYEAVTFASDQEAEVTLQTPGNNVNMGPAVRIQGTTNPACYLCFCIGFTSVQMARVDSSLNFTNLGASFAGLGLTAGSKIKLRVVGSTLTLFIDGSSQGTRTDATLTGGQPGMHGFAETGHVADNLITDWTGADFVTAASSPPSRQMRLNPALLSL